MGRAPTRNGLAISPYELGYTVPTDEQIKMRGAISMHHLFFDKDWYMGIKYRRYFRGLLPHVEPLLVPEHVNFHNRYSAPVMPSDSFMIGTLEDYMQQHGQLDVVFEKHTRDSYVVEPAQWQQAKQQYKGAR